MQQSLQRNIEISKEMYYSKLSAKLTNNKINPKCYWTILKTFLNNKKVPCIPPLIHNNQSVTDFKETANFLTHFLQSNVVLLKVEVRYLLSLYLKQINH